MRKINLNYTTSLKLWRENNSCLCRKCSRQLLSFEADSLLATSLTLPYMVMCLVSHNGILSATAQRPGTHTDFLILKRGWRNQFLSVRAGSVYSIVAW